MGFQDKNKYFLQSLSRETRNLEDMEKILLYQEEFKEDLWNRIIDSYEDSENLASFYNELILSVGEWEPDLIFLNLILDKHLFVFLREVEIPNKTYNFKFQFIENIFNGFLRSDSKLEDTLKQVLKNEAHEILGVSDQDWRSENKRHHPLIYKYGETFNRCLFENFDLINVINGYFVLVTIWYRFKVYHEPFHNIKAIVLTNKINEIFQSLDIFIDKVNRNLWEFMTYIDSIEPYLFSIKWLNYLPYTISIPESSLPGLENQIRALDKNKKKIFLLNQISRMDYLELFNQYIKYDDRLIRINIKEEIYRKLNSFILPSHSVFEFLTSKNVPDNDSGFLQLKLEFLKSNYKFEI